MNAARMLDVSRLAMTGATRLVAGTLMLLVWAARAVVRWLLESCESVEPAGDVERVRGW
jgi:hypothetical protein